MELKCGRVGMSPLIEETNGGLRKMMMKVNVSDGHISLTSGDAIVAPDSTNKQQPTSPSQRFFLSDFIHIHDTQRSSRWMQELTVIGSA